MKHLSLRETARRLRVSRHRLAALIVAGPLIARVTAKGHMYVKESDLRAFAGGVR